MQIMSSPSMSDAADTPVSGSMGSPSPHSPASTSKQILDFSKKEICEESDSTNGIQSKNSEHTESERSINSSPATLVPTPRSTPPMNGILTPPNDAEANNEPSKLGKPGGRLKFFKDGILCLELTHHGEGERTKWVQIRTKTVFPTLVHAVKEATIPCHSTPSSFASPSSLTHNNPVGSSTSHSLSDDASSMLSSPRTRESHWKQPVPQRGVSTCLEFYMKPAPCVFKVRSKLPELSNSQDQLRKRWPYNTRRTDIFIKLESSVQCCCDEVSRVLKDNRNRSSDTSNRTEESNIDSDSSSQNATKPTKARSLKQGKLSLPNVVEHLMKLAESQKLVREVNKISKSEKSHINYNGSGKRHASAKHSVPTPKKRLFNEVEPKESTSVRPKKKSPNRNHDVGKTILNVPGLNSEFYKRSSAPRTSRSPGGFSPLSGADTIDSRSSRSASEGSGNRRNVHSPHFGAKSVSSGTSSSSTLLKPGLPAELVDHFSSLAGRNAHSIRDEHISSRHQGVSLHQEEQKFLQQQTVSKAISYTINSLLGTSAISGEPPSSLTRQTGLDQSRYSQPNEAPLNMQNSRKVSKHNATPPLPSGVNSRPDQDQNSFLRHLLDTSDPIPSIKSMDRTSRSRTNPVKDNGRSSGGKPYKTNSTQHNHNHEATTGNNVNIKTKSHGTSNVSSQGSHTPTNSLSEAQKHLATNIALSSLMSSFQLNLAPPYDLLSRGGNSHSAESLQLQQLLQYGSLIPGSPFIPMNSTVAAAMASYFGTVPNISPTVPPVSQSPSNIRRNLEASTPSQRPWHGAMNGNALDSSPPFRNVASINSQISPVRSRPSSAISSHPDAEISSCGALNLSEKKKKRVEETHDIDAPLDLCKKSSR